jgi:PAS domain S-box-containing protein
MLHGPRIRDRLVILVLVGILPFVLLVASLIYDRLQHDREVEEGRAAAVARALALQLDDEIGNAMSLQIALAHSLSPARIGNASTDLVLREVMAQQPSFYSALTISDADMNVIGSSIPDLPPGSSFVGPAREAIWSAIAEGRRVVSAPFVAQRNNMPVVLFAEPIRGGDGQVVGTMNVTLSLHRIRDVFRSRQLPPGSLIHVVDRRGVGVAHSDDREDWIGFAHNSDPTVAMRALEDDNIATIAWPDGVERLTAAADLQRADWYVTVGVPSAIAFATVSQQIARTVPLSLAILALTLALAVMIARRLTRPVEQLTADAVAFGDGDLTHRTTVQSGTEIGALAEAFNRMADHLQVATDQRQRIADDLGALIDASPAPIIAVDEVATVTLWNSAAERVFGYTGEEMLGTTVPATQSDHPAGLLARFLVTGMAGHTEIQQHRKDGSPVTLSLSSAPLRSPGGEPRGMVSVWLDLTERHVVERQLLQAQKMEAVGQLTAGLGHDLNNTLGAIVANLDLLGALAEDRQDLVDCVERAMQPALKAVELVQRLQDFARSQRLDLGPVAVGASVQRLRPLIERSLGGGIVVAVDIQPDLWSAIADETQLERCVLNLVANAREAMPVGGKIGIGCRNVTIDAEMVALYDDLMPGEYVVLSVSDTGRGIAADVLPRVFEPFFTTKEIGEGRGLGLSVVYGAMQQSRGMVKIYSEPGRGTTVRLYLRRAEAVAEPLLPEPHVDAGPGGASVLVAEDNVDLRNIASTMLRGLGYEVTAVSNGDTALEVLASAPRRFDVLFTDIVMPGSLTGIDLAREARQRGLVGCVLFASGFASPMDLQERVLRRGDRLLRKPYRKSDLVEALTAVRNVGREAGQAAQASGE